MTDPIRVLLAVPFGLSLFAVGCSRDDDGPEHRIIEGTVEQIDLDTGRVSLRFFHKRSNSQQVLEGRITNETEVLINGQVAALKDIMQNERVRVTGYRIGSGANAEMVAMKVEIERPEWIDTGPAQTASHGAE